VETKFGPAKQNWNVDAWTRQVFEHLHVQLCCIWFRSQTPEYHSTKTGLGVKSRWYCCDWAKDLLSSDKAATTLLCEAVKVPADTDQFAGVGGGTRNWHTKTPFKQNTNSQLVSQKLSTFTAPTPRIYYESTVSTRKFQEMGPQLNNKGAQFYLAMIPQLHRLHSVHREDNWQQNSGSRIEPRTSQSANRSTRKEGGERGLQLFTWLGFFINICLSLNASERRKIPRDMS
jgi:hypothetical protein